MELDNKPIVWISSRLCAPRVRCSSTEAETTWSRSVARPVCATMISILNLAVMCPIVHVSCMSLPWLHWHQSLICLIPAHYRRKYSKSRSHKHTIVLLNCCFRNVISCLYSLNNVLPTPLHWIKCQICSRAKNTNTPSRTWWYFQVKRWIQDSNESAISLIAKIIVLVPKKPHFQSEFILIRSEIQADHTTRTENFSLSYYQIQV